jgi:hypothetical protein
MKGFARAVDWQVGNGMRGVSISDGTRRLTVAEFLWKTAYAEDCRHRAAKPPKSSVFDLIPSDCRKKAVVSPEVV